MLLHFVNVRSAGGNVLLWMTLSLGIGIDLAFYAAEWYARQNCPPVYVSIHGWREGTDRAVRTECRGNTMFM